MDGIIFGSTDGGQLIAGLPLLDRQVVALFRGGCKRVTVVHPARFLPGTPRSDALGYRFEHVREPFVVEEPSLVIAADVLIEAGDVARLIETGSRLESGEGVPLVAGFFPGGDLRNLEAELDELPILQAQGVAMRIRDKEDRWWAAQELWASLSSANDGLVDRCFNRPVGRVISKVLVHTDVSPNSVSIAAILIGLLSAWCFSAGAYWAALAGALLFQVSAIIDCVDGDLARIAFKESALGKWLDIGGDQVVHMAIFAGLGIGLWRMGVDAPVKPLVISALVGVAISFAVIVRGMTSCRSDENAALRRLIDRMANRDFSVLLIAMAAADRLVWFLWLLGIGVHAFWLLALVAQAGGGRRR